MAFKLGSRVLETFTTTGTGTVTLGGAVAKHRTFASVMSNADTCFYFMEGGSDWEIGYGTYSGGALARTAVLKSSNSNNAVNWASGMKTVGMAPVGPSDLDATNLGRLQGALGVSSFIQTLLDDADAGTAQTTLGISAFIKTLLDDASATAALATLGVVVGTTTPTGTGVANVDSISSIVVQYIRVGSIVVGAFYCAVDATAAGGTTTTARFPPPVASDFTVSSDLSGVLATAGIWQVGDVSADVTNNAVQIRFPSVSTSPVAITGVFGYVIK